MGSYSRFYVYVTSILFFVFCLVFFVHANAILSTVWSVLRQCQRLLATDGATARITTHYTVVPRENDPRWKGQRL